MSTHDHPTEPIVRDEPPVREQPLVHDERVVRDERTVREEPVVERPVVERRVASDAVVVRDGPSGVTVARRAVVLLFGVLQALLLLRIGLLALGANEGNDIVGSVLAVTDPFVAPFRGMFDVDQAGGAGDTVLDVAALVALVGWTLVEALVLGVLSLADRRERVAV